MKTARETLTDRHVLSVACWSQTGDAYEEMGEDGPRVLNPPTQPVVLLLTPCGRLYALDAQFGEGGWPNTKHWTRAEAEAEGYAWKAAYDLIDRIRATGSVNMAKWHYLRGTYGSESYFEDGWHDLDKRLD